MIVVDAGVVALAVADDGPNGSAARRRLRAADDAILAPELLWPEAANVIRRARRIERLSPERADAAIDHLARINVTSFGHAGLLPAAWKLQLNLTACDAFYVALAIEAEATLVTIDARLTRSPVVTCSTELLDGNL